MLLGLLLSLALSDSALDVANPKSLVQKESLGDPLLREAKGMRYAQRFFEAAALYRRHLSQYPTSSRASEARFWLAATLEQDQRWDEAAAAYTEFLLKHPDERMLGKEARLNRVRCWGIRQGQASEATQGLLAALGDESPEIQVAAALQLAKTGDRRPIEALQKGLGMPTQAEACRLALIGLGAKPQPQASSANRFLVMRIKEKGKKDPVTIRLALSLARAMENYLSDEQILQARRKGVELSNLSDRAANMPKGSLIFSVEDGKSDISVTVE